MTVYFAQARADRSTVKIGYTSDFIKRQKNMSTSAPGGIAILATLPGGRETEEYLHEKFADDRVSGEWFTYSDQIRQFINDALNKKPGLIPFGGAPIFKRHSTAEFSAEALERARQMAVDILNAEFRGFHDTRAAAKHRIEKKFGLKSSMLHRLLYRGDMHDVTAGVFPHLQDIHEQVCINKPKPPRTAATDQDRARQSRAEDRARL